MAKKPESRDAHVSRLLLELVFLRETWTVGFFKQTQRYLYRHAPGSGFFLYSNFANASKRSTRPVAIDTASATAERFSRVIPVLLTVGTPGIGAR
jgi:hypothetical protein